MEVFLILQILFDAVLLFGLLFLFHFSVHQVQKKKEESDLLKDIQVQEIKENLQELLLTLKQLGKEVSDNIQEEVKEAEEKTEIFKKVVLKLQKDLTKVTKLSDEVNAERTHLEEKAKAIETAKRIVSKVLPPTKSSFSETTVKGEKRVRNKMEKSEVPPGLGFDGSEKTMGFSSGLVREVYRLADKKTVINEIIQRTQLSRAEVQLILNLRGNRFTAPN
jgi:hypothetical protein